MRREKNGSEVQEMNSGIEERQYRTSTSGVEKDNVTKIERCQKSDNATAEWAMVEKKPNGPSIIKWPI